MYLEFLRDDRRYKLINKNKRALPFRYNTAEGQEVHIEVEDQSDLLRGQIMILDELIELPEVLLKKAQSEVEARAIQNKKENEGGV